MAKKKSIRKKAPARKLFDDTPTSGPVTLPMLPVEQGPYKMVAFVADSKHLLKIVSFSRRAEDQQNGFQRHFKDARLRQIARYIDLNGTIPNNIILDLDDSRVTVDWEANTITLPADSSCALVIDGQHRLLSFNYANQSYPLLVLGYIGLDEKKKVDIFVTINTEQKRLPTSLCLDLLNIIGSEGDIDTRCRDIVATLNEDDESPWYGQIDMTGESKAAYISLVNFVRKLRPLLTGAGFMKSLDLTAQTKIMLNYWKGIRAVFSDQWGTSLLTKTVGFGALMNILPAVFPTIQAMNKGRFTPSSVIDTFKLIKDFRFDGETLGSGAGNKAEMRAGDIVQEALTTAIQAYSGSNQSPLILD